MTQNSTAALPDDELAPHLDLFDPEHTVRSLDVLKYAREHCPILKTDADDGYYIASRYADVRAVTQDPLTFSSVQAGLRGIPIPMPPLTVDPPQHTEYRRQLNPYLSQAFLAGYEPDVRAIAVELLDPLVPSGRMEFISDFAAPLTAKALAKIILDADDQEQIERGARITSAIATEGSAQAFFDMAELAEELLRERAASGSDRDDILTAITRASVDGRPLEMAEQVGFTAVLMNGGLDTTKAAMGNIVCRLLDDTQLEERLRDPEWVRFDLDEYLRLDSPVRYMARTVTRDTELSGCPLQAGDRIAIHFASANRDEQQFADADRLDLTRESNAHAAFGLGAHRCIGIHFARMQLRIGFEELLRRVTNVRLAPGEQVEMSSGVVNGPERLPIAFDRL